MDEIVRTLLGPVRNEPTHDASSFDCPLLSYHLMMNMERVEKRREEKKEKKIRGKKRIAEIKRDVSSVSSTEKILANTLPVKKRNFRK